MMTARHSLPGSEGASMKRILITGMSGTGKSTVIAALTRRGYRAVGTDAEGYSHLVTVPEDEPTGLEPGTDWVWREDRMEALLATDEGDVLFVAGTAPNQGTFYDRFDSIILLSAPDEVMAERLATRTTNPYGSRPGEIARSLQMKVMVEPLLRRSADLEIDTSAPLEDVVEAILRHAVSRE
jgi:broad-specificity NMP kinase